jgi:hypothetical protein
VWRGCTQTCVCTKARGLTKLDCLGTRHDHAFVCGPARRAMAWRRAGIRGEEPELFVGLGDAVISRPAFQEHGWAGAGMHRQPPPRLLDCWVSRGHKSAKILLTVSLKRWKTARLFMTCGFKRRCERGVPNSVTRDLRRLTASDGCDSPYNSAHLTIDPICGDVDESEH